MKKIEIFAYLSALLWANGNTVYTDSSDLVYDAFMNFNSNNNTLSTLQ